MNKRSKAMIIMEIAGMIFVLLSSLFMSKLNDLCGGSLVGMMFGSVNQSIWESCKTLLLPYLIWGMIELLSLSVHMHAFTVAKTISLFFLGIAYTALRLIYGYDKPCIFAAVICVTAAFALSFLLCNSKFDLSALFPVSVFLLFLFWALYFSFTPFPPKSLIFLDPQTGIYGIIPAHFDLGAAELDAIYYIS